MAYEGIVNNLERRYRETNSDMVKGEIARYMRDVPCTVCHGKRLKPEALAVTIGGLNIYDMCELSVTNMDKFIGSLTLTETEEMIARRILKEIHARLNFLINVGLGYLTLSRSASTLSGGESQRIRLATQIGSGLTGVLYILDEPSRVPRGPANYTASLTSQRHRGKFTKVPCTSRGNQGFPAPTRKRPRESFFKAS